MRRAASAALAAAAIAGLAACSPLTPGDLPLEGSAPWACDGVSRGSIDLILGEGYTIVQTGDWRDLDALSFLCEVNGIHGHVQVEVTDLGEGDAATTSAAERLEGWRAADGETIPNNASVPGSGYRTGAPDDLGETVTAGWVCGRRVAEVRLISVWDDGTRDQRADAVNLLYQVLPYACGGKAVPGVDYTPDDAGD